MVRLDLHYIRNWSFALDMEILLRTIPAVLSTKGAY
jgi:lipopolysaccharide/colanic/teichoic acid biosynthesis glycosyltransferase